MIIISKWKDLIIHLLFFDNIVMLYVSPFSKIADERLHLNSIITEKMTKYMFRNQPRSTGHENCRNRRMNS